MTLAERYVLETLLGLVVCAAAFLLGFVAWGMP